MIFKNLYQTALIEPCREGADRLNIVSGYATSAMAFHHLEDLKDYNISISLLIGMCPADGMSYSNHRGFQNILNSAYSDRFSCSYVYNSPPVHTKLYSWYRCGHLYKSFIGSANYTQNAFSRNQMEALEESDDSSVAEYYRFIEQQSVYCNSFEAEELVKIYNDKNYYQKHIHEDIQVFPRTDGLESIRVSLLSSRTGEVQNRGGLNWGQREGREPNQAYIQLSPDVYNSDFFPKAPQHFTVLTDDNKSFICRRAEKDEQGQTIHTPDNNSLLGEYFRYRLGLANGAFVTRADLELYGRTDLTFYKFDDENFLMDFKVPPI